MGPTYHVCRGFCRGAKRQLKDKTAPRSAKSSSNFECNGEYRTAICARRLNGDVAAVSFDELRRQIEAESRTRRIRLCGVRAATEFREQPFAIDRRDDNSGVLDSEFNLDSTVITPFFKKFDLKPFRSMGLFLSKA
jgi:hypothetical protein